MKKKIIGIFFCMLMILSAIPIYASNTTVDNKNSTYPKSVTQNLLKHPLMKNISELDPNETSSKPHMGNPPAEFSWKNYQGRDWTTPAKNQGNLGTCWCFAAIGALESVINIQEENAELDLDLSEQYVVSCLPAAGTVFGGSSFLVYKFIMDTSPEGNFYNGIIPETCFPYQGIEGVPCSDKCDDWVGHLIPIQGCGSWIPDGSSEDRDRIKTQILEKGPVVTSMFVTDMFTYWGSFFHKPSQVFSTHTKTSSWNHYVVIVGWKDDPNIMNGGYWIAKNSWGTDWGYDGFFNIAYGCLCIDEIYITWVEYDSPTIDSPPIADAGGPYFGSVGQDIFFDARKSFDSEGDIISYEWDFGDGTQSVGDTATHAFSKSGGYVVNLTVTDGSGQKDSEEISVLVDFWQIGDSWEFNVNFYFDYNFGYLPQFLTFSSNDFVFKVVGETDENYFLEYKGVASGFIKLFLFKKPAKSVNVTGNIIVRKYDLGIINYNMTSYGEIGLLRIPFTTMMNAEFNPPWQIFLFPFYSDRVFIFGRSIVTHNVSMKIGNALEILKSSYGIVHGLFLGICEENLITVPAGTFTTFHLDYGIDDLTRQFEYYYSPDVRNIVKFSLIYNMSYLFTTNPYRKYFGIDLELVSYTCSKK